MPLLKNQKALFPGRQQTWRSLPSGIKRFEELCLQFGLELYAAEMGFLPADVGSINQGKQKESLLLKAAEVIPMGSKHDQMGNAKTWLKRPT